MKHLLTLSLFLPVIILGQPAIPSPAFSVTPMRMEIEVAAGAEKTGVFEISTAPSTQLERGRVLISPMDWGLHEDGRLTYSETASGPQSALSWIQTSPAAVTTEPGQNYPIRVTVRVPPGTAPGVYRAGLFIQERPIVTPLKPGDKIFSIRVRYANVIYVIVPPVFAKPELENLDTDLSNGDLRLIAHLKNSGTRHVRPLVTWRIRNAADKSEIASGRRDSPALLPSAILREPFAIRDFKLTPGNYEAVVEVDFQDGKPVQAMTRAFVIPPPATPPPTPPQEVATDAPSPGTPR